MEELGRLKVSELYANNASSLDAINEATIKTAVMEELERNGYEVKDISTTTTVKGLLIQDDTGNNIDEVGLVQGTEKTIKVALDTEGNTTSNTYVKIDGNYYELTINEQELNVSREAYKQVGSDANSYEIKMTPPTEGVTVTAGGVVINGESPVTSETEIKVIAGETTGTFVFNVKETKTSKTRNVNVVVTTIPKYATGITIGTKENVAAEVEAGKTLQLTATVTPNTSTDTVKWSIASGSGEITNKGLLTANSDATANSKITVLATCQREDGTTTNVKDTIEITVKEKAGESAGTPVDTAKTKVGYYADIEGDGTVDGVIYADLAFNVSDQWENSYGAFSYTAQSGLKEYVIKEATYNDGHFGDHPVIAPKEGTSGKDRFYVMALSDISSSKYYWDYYYDTEYNNKNYNTSENFVTGKSNTEKMVNYWNTHSSVYIESGQWKGMTINSWNSSDIWANVKDKFSKGWFVPSRAEWGAFGKNLGISTWDIASSFGLSDGYWSSSQVSLGTYYYAWNADFYYGGVGSDFVDVNYYVRLSTTF